MQLVIVLLTRNYIKINTKLIRENNSSEEIHIDRTQFVYVNFYPFNVIVLVNYLLSSPTKMMSSVAQQFSPKALGGEVPDSVPNRTSLGHEFF